VVECRSLPAKTLTGKNIRALLVILALSVWPYFYFTHEASGLAMEFEGVTPPLVRSDTRANKTVIYHIGWDTGYGQTNTQLFSILRALDKLFDETGEWHGNRTNSSAAVAVSGWASENLRMFFAPQAQKEPDPRGTLAKRKKEDNWILRLERKSANRYLHPVQ
jgi:hypothetical protein